MEEQVGYWVIILKDFGVVFGADNDKSRHSGNKNNSFIVLGETRKNLISKDLISKVENIYGEPE